MEKLELETTKVSDAAGRGHGQPTLREARSGLAIEPLFCPAEVADPFDTVEWELRSAAIKGEDGQVLFEQRDCEIPATWSQLAANVVVSKYFYGEVNTPEREKSVRQLIHRVARTIADWGTADGYFATQHDGERFYRELTWLCLHQHASFNSPVWFNVGLYHQYGVRGAMCNWHWNPKSRQVEQPENPYEYPQGSACFIQSVHDNMEDIMELARAEAMLFKFGSGTGTDLSTLRSHREKLSGGGRPSGPLSFMRVYDQIAAVVKSGGKTRRAAKMQSLKVMHPDIMEFVECKRREERKARMLIEKGVDPEEAVGSVLFQNANLSVRVTDDFMKAVESDGTWTTHWVTQPEREGPSCPARKMMDTIADCAWECGDPGLQYDTTINRWHTCPNSGRINASNPCVTGDTLVATSEGWKTIESLVGTTPDVVGSDGKLHTTAQVICTGTRPVFRLRTRGGYELRLTGDHRVRTANRGDVRADQLRARDKIELCRVHFGQKHMERDAAEALGEALGRGESNVGYVLDHKLHIAVGLSDCASGVAHAIAGPPEYLFSLDQHAVADVIRGFYRAQGCPQDTAYFSSHLPCGAKFVPLQHSCRELLGQLQLLLLAFGIKSEFRQNDGHTPDETLYILPPYFGRFIDVVDGRIHVASMPVVEPDEFDSLEPLGEEPVFDLTEPVTHHFVANGLVVHNCSEYMFLDDSACNLASVNLMKFRRDDGSFDVDRFVAACRIVFIAQEILVDHASYPTKKIAEKSHLFRPIGLGYSNLGSLIMASGLAYDSDEARGLCGAVTALLHGAANRTSSELAGAVGPFEGFDANREPMLHVMEMHWEQAEKIRHAPAYLKAAAQKLWDEVLSGGRRHGFRNAQATVLAPTGTISFMMDCDTTGIEPDIALVKYKQLAGGGMLKIVNQTVPLALRTLGYSEPEVKSIVAYIDKEDTIEGAAALRSEHLPVFDCAFQPANGVRSIGWKAHILMMAAAQPFVSGAISKTVNLPKDCTPQDIREAYVEGWRLGLKALAVYRDGSKNTQVLSTKSETDKAAEKAVAAPRRERLPDTRQSITHKFSVAGHEGYITVGMYPDGRPGELFITMAKEGSTVGGLMDCFGTAVSMSLQYGVPLEVYVNKFSHTRFEPMGHTPNPDIRFAKSIVDYIFRWLGVTFLPEFREANRAAMQGPGEPAQPPGVAETEAERLPAAMKAGGQKAPQGATATSAPPNGSSHGSPNGASHAAPNGRTNGKSAPGKTLAAPAAAAIARAAAVRQADYGPQTERSGQFALFQEDAPACDNCGSITVRNGNCYLCHNCGNSMGCS